MSQFLSIASERFQNSHTDSRHQTTLDAWFFAMGTSPQCMNEFKTQCQRGQMTPLRIVTITEACVFQKCHSTWTNVFPHDTPCAMKIHEIVSGPVWVMGATFTYFHSCSSLAGPLSQTPVAWGSAESNALTPRAVVSFLYVFVFFANNTAIQQTDLYLREWS